MGTHSELTRHPVLLASLPGVVYLLLCTGVRARILAPLYPSPEIATLDIVAAFALGCANDLIAACILSWPLAVLLLCWRGKSPARRRALTGLLAIELLVVVIVLAIELAVWQELDMRIGRFAAQYIVYLQATAYFGLEYLQGMSWRVWVTGLTLFALSAWLATRVASALTPGMAESSREQCRPRQLAVYLLVSGILVGIYFVLPEARVSERFNLNNAAENTFTHILRSAFRDDTRWLGVYADLPEDETRRRLAAIWPGHAPESGAERLATNATLGHPAGSDGAQSAAGIRHLVLIIEESFGGHHWTNLANRERYMPEFLRLSDEGRLFTHVYATGLRTVRGLEALLQGIVPVPGFSRTTLGSGSRLPSLSASLKAAGFRTGFVYGGWPTFTNFANYWSSIGFERVLSRHDFPHAGFETSWGIADEFLFDRLLTEMDDMTQHSERVFLATLTVSNHLPFAFPEGRVPYASGTQAPALGYADWALGRFMDAARSKDWFADTLFVIASDHGYGRLGHARIPLTPYRVPLLFFAPGHIAPGHISAVSSNMEVPRTILCLLELPDCTAFRGRNLLALGHQEHGVAPIEFASLLALVNIDGVTLLLHNEEAESWHRDASGTLRLTETDQEMAYNASAIFRTAMQDFHGELR